MKIGNETFGKEDAKRLLFVALSALIYSLDFNFFVKQGNLFPGGFSGLSRLLSQVTGLFLENAIPFSLFYFGLNFLLTIFVWHKIGHKFILYSFLWYTLTSFLVSVLPEMEFTDDLLLIAIFGGLINGFALGLALRNNASSGGTDFIAIYLSMRYNIPTWNYVLAGNAVVLTLAGLLFGWDRALYSIIFQYVSTQTVNVMHQRYKLTTLNVITNIPNEVCQSVFHIVRHGITKLPCQGGYTDQPHWMLIMTINTYQSREVIEAIRKADSHAFITVNSVNRIVGNYYQKPLE